jgi:hypothetical protein
MNCFICERTKEDIVLLKLPLEAVFEKSYLEILGNLDDGEYICLGCMGYQFDEVETYREQLKHDL